MDNVTEPYMHFFVFRVRQAGPRKDGRHEGYASCWICNPSVEAGQKEAENLIAESGWNVDEMVENYPITRQAYVTKKEGLEYYEQALIDKQVVVIFMAKK